VSRAASANVVLPPALAGGVLLDDLDSRLQPGFSSRIYPMAEAMSEVRLKPAAKQRKFPLPPAEAGGKKEHFCRADVGRKQVHSTSPASRAIARCTFNLCMHIPIRLNHRCVSQSITRNFSTQLSECPRRGAADERLFIVQALNE
jgi:hypothetical protein